MKVKVTRNVFVSGEPYEAGKEYDMNGRDAKTLISMKKAQPVEAGPAPAATKSGDEQTTRPAKSKR